MKIHVYMRQQSRAVGGGISPHMINCVEGLRRHGLDVSVFEPGVVSDCDLAVCWGVKKTAAIASGRRALVFERGYVGDRFYWTSVGYDGLNGRADFLAYSKDDSRKKMLLAHCPDLLKPWRGVSGSYVLVMGQVPGDASLAGIDIFSWYTDTVALLRRAGHEVRFRYHPLAVRARAIPGTITARGSLEDAFAGAKWVVTYNSNSAVDAILAGIPTITTDIGSMAWSVTEHHPCQITQDEPDRETWLNDLAWCQWSPEEIRNGDFWDHLRVGME